MTTRNFRVNNGLSVGDITISASANTITGLATSAPSADGDVSNKKYVDDSIAAISTSAITQGNSNVTVTDSGTGAITVSADGTETMNMAAAATTITASGNINLTAGADVAIPNDIGVLFGNGGEKIESDGTDLTVTSTGVLTLTATGDTAITNNATIGGNLTLTGNLTVNGDTTTVSSTNTTIADNIIELNTGISASSNDAGIIIERGSTGNNACILWDESADKFTMGTTTATAADKSGGITVAISTLVANLEGTATAAQYSDVAERFASDSAYTPGTVVALGGAEEITQVNEEGSDEVFGVISSLDQAAFKMNGGAGNDETHPYIAMTGRVDVKVIGTVNKGDRLISASVPGYARAATKAECTAFNVIGRALTSKSEAGQGSVLAAVRVSH
jgi:hypothetical protein